MTLAEFDRLPEAERDMWVADWQIDRLECRDCGRPVAECSDPKRKFYPYRRVCYATMERDAAQAAYSDLHGEDAGWHDGTFTRWAAERSAAFPYSASSGVSIHVADADVAPWDDFTTNRDASPIEPKSLPEQAPREQDNAGD